MSMIFYLSFLSPNSTRKRSSSISEMWTPLFIFQAILIVFCRASMFMLLYVRICMTMQFSPNALVALVLSPPRMISSSSSLVRVSFFQNSSRSSTIMVCFRFLCEVVMGGEKKGREEKRRKKTRKFHGGTTDFLQEARPTLSLCSREETRDAR